MSLSFFYLISNNICDFVGSNETLACENIRFSSLFAAGDVSQTSTSTKSGDKRMFSQANETLKVMLRESRLATMIFSATQQYNIVGVDSAPLVSHLCHWPKIIVNSKQIF